MKHLILIIQSSLIALITFNLFPSCLIAEENIKEVFVTTTDYQTGSCSLMNLASYNVKKDLSALYSDAVSKYYDGKIYVINRFGADNITAFTPPDYSTPTLQFSTGNGSNPHDIVFLDNEKAFITLYEENYLLIVNPQNGTELSQIDLSEYADSDGIPEMDRMLLVGDRLFITLQRLDRNNYFEPTDYSSVLVYDPGKEIIIEEIKLAASNPIDIGYSSGLDKIVVAEAGSYMDYADGGLETINPNSLKAEGIQISEAILGGNMGGAYSAIVLEEDGSGYAVVQDDNWNTMLAGFNLSNNEMSGIIHAPETGFVHAGITLANGLLLIADRTLEEPGIRIFNTSDNFELTSIPIDVGLPPFCITPVTQESYISEPCPLEIAFEGEDSLLSLLRWWRDTILKDNERGRVLTSLYYKHAGEISSMVRGNQTLREMIAQTIREGLPCLISTLFGKKATLQESHLTKTLRLINIIRDNASPDLKKDIKHFNYGELLEHLQIKVLDQNNSIRLSEEGF